MKNTTIVVVILIIVGAFFYLRKDDIQVVTPSPTPSTQASIKGCYVANLAKDVYTLKVDSEAGNAFTGKLSFKNFEKDSSSGTYVGNYQNGILLGDYSFASEGMNSKMEVIFKRVGDTFVRGFGDLNEDGTRFKDLNNINFDPKQTFILSATCPI